MLSNKLFTKFINNVHNLVPMEILLDSGHWVHLARGHPPLGQVHPMAII